MTYLHQAQRAVELIEELRALNDEVEGDLLKSYSSAIELAVKSIKRRIAYEEFEDTMGGAPMPFAVV